jgi:hypothetical protein
MEDKYTAICLLFALHDIIGYDMRNWTDTSKYEVKIYFEYISRFIDLGGISGYDISSLYFSQYTYYFRAFSKYLLKHYDEYGLDRDKIKSYKKKYDKYIVNDTKHKIIRNEYSAFFSVIDAKVKNTSEYSVIEQYINPSYKSIFISIPFALKFYLEEDLDKLIDSTMFISNISVNEMLGSFVSAYFITLGLRDILIEKWIPLLLLLLESDKIKKHIGDGENEQQDYLRFVRYWNIYYDTRFNNNKPIKTFTTNNLTFRIKYFHETFRNKDVNYFGEESYYSLIIHYDALLSCDGIWEKFLYYSTMHHVWHATAFAGALFGSVYLFNGVPEHFKNNIEQKDKMIILSKKMFKTFAKII